MYAKIAESAKKFDMLGLEINFLVNGSKTYNTFPGLFFTSLIASFLLKWSESYHLEDKSISGIK